MSRSERTCASSRTDGDALLLAGRREDAGRVRLEPPLPAEVAEEGAQPRELAGGGRLREPAPVQLGEEAADREVVGVLGARLPAELAAQVLGELREVLAVGPDRVRRGVPLELQVAEEGRGRGPHPASRPRRPPRGRRLEPRLEPREALEGAVGEGEPLLRLVPHPLRQLRQEPEGDVRGLVVRGVAARDVAAERAEGGVLREGAAAPRRARGRRRRARRGGPTRRTRRSPRRRTSARRRRAPSSAASRRWARG